MSMEFTLELQDVTTVEPNTFAIRWRIAGTANVPFPGLRIKPYIAPQAELRHQELLKSFS